MLRKNPSIIASAIAVLLLASAASCVEKKMASAYIYSGMSFYEKGNYIEAILELRSAEQLSPNPAGVNKYLGMAYSKMSLWREAAKEYNKILFVDPADPDRETVLRRIHDWEIRTDYTPAMAMYSFYSIKYKNKIFSDPENLLNYLSLAEIYKCSGRYTEAENFFRALIKDSPQKVVFRKYLAEALYFDSKYSEAGTLYRRILEEEPLNTDALVGINLIMKKRYEEAIQKFPDNLVNHLKLARVLKDMKRYEDSIAEYDKYLAKDSANADVIRERAETEKILKALTSTRL